MSSIASAAYSLARPALFWLDGERAHDLTLQAAAVAARAGLLRAPHPIAGKRVKLMGLDFANPVGLAAGLDKNGAFIDALGSFGFGHIEVGTVTPRAQPGNPKPRMFRIPRAQALINRMGFNNLGVDNLVENVNRRRYDGILGINIGKNFDTPVESAESDYVHCLKKVYTFADYITVNISSPNTRGLRDLQQGAALERLLSALMQERNRLAKAAQRRVPLAVKIAPDLDDDAIDAAAEAFLKFEVDAVIATNTTLSRDAVTGMAHADEPGGLSGAPLLSRATHVVARLHQSLSSRIPIIGVGGILSVADARAKFAAGAQLVQIYSGLIYRGPELAAEIIRDTGGAS